MLFSIACAWHYESINIVTDLFNNFEKLPDLMNILIIHSTNNNNLFNIFTDLII